MKRLVVAAGGGGDVIAATMLRTALFGPAAPALVLTYSWERLTVDPLPGPRGGSDFTGLAVPLPGLELVTGGTAPVAPAGSSLPRLARELGSPLGLLDPYEGAFGLARTLTAAAAYCGAARIEVVDVGGDIVAAGDEPTLRSPLGDALVLAACARTGLPTDVHVAGPGLDREVPEAELFARLPPAAFSLGADAVAPVRPVFDWHPSEASAMLAAAARGVRGLCGIRDVPEPLRLDARSAGVHRLSLSQALARNPLARLLTDCRSLAEAELASVEVCGFSEIARERVRAAAPAETAPDDAEFPVPTGAGSADVVTRHARWQAELGSRGITLVTRRRLVEGLALDRAADLLLRARLGADPAQNAAPLWRVPGRAAPRG
ncbi:DUF1152 domain-containing protein [Streptomyces sp. CB03911]|uniref:DUF1152 domain-containing protein n=1 Tax=Streptomycetaceae TaxID=2062 RepID=UPI00093B2384|nr:DUF1152 domain-containing protein [Streptomyces sp. CB03911]